MPVNLCCCRPKCSIPSAYLIRPTGLILCCGILSLTPINGVTFVYLPQGFKNFYIGTAKNYLQTTTYDGSSNCDTSTPVNSVLAIDYAPHYAGPAPPSGLFLDNYAYSGPGNPLFDLAGQNGAMGAAVPHDGMIFAWDSSVAGPPAPTLPVGTITVPNNYNDSLGVCTFPDPFANNNIAYGGTARIAPVCTAITITASSPTGTVSNAAGTGSVTFTAVNATGGPGDWYAAKLGTVDAGAAMSVIFGSGIYTDDFTFTSATSGTGGTTITFSYTANTSGSARKFGIGINDKTYSFTQNP